MKRLFLPALLVLASIVSVAVFTTVTASTLASMSKDNKSNVTVTEQQSSGGDLSAVH